LGKLKRKNKMETKDKKEATEMVKVLDEKTDDKNSDKKDDNKDTHEKGPCCGVCGG
jgi:hypothetical protein